MRVQLYTFYANILSDIFGFGEMDPYHYRQCFIKFL